MTIWLIAVVPLLFMVFALVMEQVEAHLGRAARKDVVAASSFAGAGRTPTSTGDVAAAVDPLVSV